MALLRLVRRDVRAAWWAWECADGTAEAVTWVLHEVHKGHVLLRNLASLTEAGN